jgi:hypothetical protein
MARKPKPTLSKEALSTAKKVVKVIAPHVPVESIEDMTIAETVINYAWQEAQVLKKNLEAYLSNSAETVNNEE